MKVRGPKKLQAANTRARIEDSAMRLFVVKGFRGTSTAQIAQSAGLSAGALYVHYPSKEALLLSLLARWETEFLNAVVADVTAHGGDSRAKLHRMLSFGAKFAVEKKDLCLLVAIVSADLRCSEGPIGVELRRLYDAHAQFVAGLAEEAKKEGVFDPSLDSKTLGYFIVAVLDGILLQWQHPAGWAEGRELVRTFRQMLFKGCEPPRK